MDSYKVKLLGRNLTIVKQDVHPGADPENQGCAFCTNDLVFVNSADKEYSFDVLIHELMHHFFWIGGRRDDDEQSNLEHICNIVPAFINAMINENGFDIFGKLSVWVSEEEEGQ